MNLKNTCARTGAYILIDSLVQNGVEHIFGYPGGYTIKEKLRELN